MAIAFTQFMRPNGRRETVTVERPAEIETIARALIARGVAFEAEVLMTGQVSFEACLPDADDGDPLSLSMQIVSNGPAVLDAVDLLVREADDALREYEARRP